MSGNVENGYRGHLVCAGLHDGPAGFQVPSNAQAARGASLIAALRPNAGKRAGSEALVDGKRYQVIASERSAVPGFFVLLLRESA